MLKTVKKISFRTLFLSLAFFFFAFFLSLYNNKDSYISSSHLLIFSCLFLALNAGWIDIKSTHLNTQYVPIPKRYPGIDLPASQSLVTVELVYDAACYATVIFDHKFRQVVHSLTQSHPNKFSYKYSLQVLPYHISDYKLTQAINYVNAHQGPKEALDLLHHFLDTNQTWTEQAISSLSVKSFMDKVARDVSDVTGISQEDIRKEIQHNSNTDRQTRKWVKYAMGTLHAPGTPLFYINGARVEGRDTLTAEQMIAMLTALI